ncbi:MAG: PAS domain-containing protein [Deltaproteobacteria bacterium]|nr:PAS domain-containing protein [Deltaproteobacteria bacterium]
MMEEVSILKTIAREMLSGVLVLDRGGKILYANPFFTRCFSIEGDIRGRRIRAVMGKSGFLKAVEGALKEAVEDGWMAEAEGGEIEINEKDRFFKIRIVPISRDAASGVMLFLRDITEEKRVEAIKKDFVANVSHELRTPLASIKGYAETLLDGGMEDEKTLKEFLGVIDRHATRMSRLIDDLLVLSKLESHQMPMVVEAVDIRELISSIAEGFKKQALDKGIRLELSMASALPSVLSDRVRLEQVMVNLLDNAIKYTPAAGSVLVAASVTNGTVRVDVRDTGMGIPSSDIPRIFERFYRVDRARSREMGGTGLGLAIVKHIIHALNGRVWVESTPAKGSTFSFTLKTAPHASV